MNQQDIRHEIEKVLDHDHVGTMATIKNNKPQSRYMTFHHENLQLFTATNEETHKTEEIIKNPYTHVILGYEGDGYGDAYVEYEGKVSISDSPTLKEKLWVEEMEKWFDGPDDPNYIVLEINPTQIRLMNKNNHTSEQLELDLM
ncbi:pyridoxamine 5'-phosphate oxidase family protein [Virgibacillus sp. W0181]|uniref:pyridoxamine 5'-phosphate oxidase family protein n=1 Tax=Virgibacillus sp. W0181 TaxID=3391581 RepID=UPI003F474545